MEIRPAAIIIDDAQQQILLLHYCYSGTTVYNIPGGRLECGETMAAALERELEEELGISIEVGKLLFVGEVILPDKNNKTTLHCLFAARLLAGTPTPNPNQTKAIAAVWLPLSALSGIALYPNVGQPILQYYCAEKAAPHNGEMTYIGRIEQMWY